MSLLLLLAYNLAGIEFDEHGAIGVQFLNGNGEAEVVKEEELEFKMI